jgi:gamma-glutamylcyclotransferase (GGCT)/AIG2-like uncharacterized protein YtfP
MNGPGILQLFVYGSLRKGFKSPMYDYISKFFTYVGDAKVRGKVFDMGSYAAGLPSRDNSFIIGELYAMNHEADFSWVIGQLDDYEGVNVEPDEMQLYRRDITEVFINNSVTHAWIYWFNGDVSGKVLIASGDLMKYLYEKK